MPTKFNVKVRLIIIMIDWIDGSIHFVSDNVDKFIPLEKYLENDADINMTLKELFESAVDLNSNWAKMAVSDVQINGDDLELTYTTMVPLDSNFTKPIVDTSKVGKDHELLVTKCYKLAVWGAETQ